MFTKNMVITLLVAVGVTLLFRQFGGVKEGMKEGAEHAEEEKKGEKKSADEEEEDDNETETETEQFSTSKTMEMMKMQERLLDKAESMAPRVEKLMSQFGGKNMSGLKNMLG
jgi:hypothetical protein